jgi:glycosyltransferase involved in cell wall biosynthesis
VAGGIPPDKIVIKPNFVDPDPQIGAGDGGYALFVGRLTDEKGVRTLLTAWKSNAVNVGLKILGDGPLREEVVEAASRTPHKIEYLGRRPLAEVYDVIGRARVLVFPSQWYEGLPRTIVESYAKGTPVIASRLGSMTELIEPGRSGLLFEAGDADDLARQVARVTGSPDELVQMRVGARRLYEERYTAERNYPVLLGAYAQALNGRHAAR